jgi:hypothetical protein
MRWWEGLAPAEATGPSEEAADHRLVWTDGELRLEAHADPEAEQALGALGGERCPCLDVLDAWTATHADGGILGVGARGVDDPVRPPAAAVASLMADLRRWRATSGSLVEESRRSRDTHALDRLVAVAGPAERAAARRLGFLLLLGLGPDLLQRLQCSVAAGLAERGDGGRALLTAATAGRALPWLRAIGWSGGLEDVTLGAEAKVGGSGDGGVVLPPGWIARVWSRPWLAGAVPGALVVDVVDRAADGTLEVLAAAPGKAQVVVRVAPVGE